MIQMHRKVYPDQFVFQREHLCGRALNVGSNTDGARLAADYGAVNVDLRQVDHVTGERLPVGVLADARRLPFFETFDTIVLGELIEHMEQPDAVMTLIEARRALRAGGRLVITVPHDGRRDNGALPVPEGAAQFYAPGIYAYHYRTIGRLELLRWIRAAGLTVELLARIAYPWGEEGSAILASVEREAA